MRFLYWFSKKITGKDFINLSTGSRIGVTTLLVSIIFGIIAGLGWLFNFFVSQPWNKTPEVREKTPVFEEKNLPAPTLTLPCYSNFLPGEWQNEDLFIRYENNILSFDPSNPRSRSGAIMFFNQSLTGNFSVKFQYKGISSSQESEITKNVVLQVDDFYRLIIGSGSVKTLVLEQKTAGKWVAKADVRDIKTQQLSYGIAPNRDVIVILRQNVLSPSVSGITVSLTYFPIENPNSPSIPLPAFEYKLKDYDFSTDVPVGVGIIEDPNLKFEFIDFECNEENY